MVSTTSPILWYGDTTPHYSWRLYINVTEGQDVPTYEKRVLDDLCVWSGSDKYHECKDGSVMYSWEFPKEFIDAVRKLTMKWQSRLNWKESLPTEVWKD